MVAVVTLSEAGRTAQARRKQARGNRGRFSAGPKSYEWLLQEPIIRDWIDAYTSSETREKKLYQLEKVLGASGLGEISQLLQLPDREIKILVKRVANRYLQEGKGVWARQIIITMKGFLESQDRSLEFKRSERIRTPAKKKIGYEHVPSREEAYRIADNSGSLRNAAMILCLFQSGVRVGCLCNWTYGLVSRQLSPTISPPVRIKVTPSLDSKLGSYGLSYYVTGLGEEAALTLKRYLQLRISAGWDPEPDDPIFVTEEQPDEQVKREAVWRIVKASVKRSGLDPKGVWVHCLRKSFRKVLNATPQIDEDTKEALMGHKLPGSRGSYFDYHDEDEVMSKYMQADFSRPSNSTYEFPQTNSTC